MKIRILILAVPLVTTLVLLPQAFGVQEKNTPTWTDPEVAAKEFRGFTHLGEYVKGNKAIQVVPAEGKFYLSIYQGGLPGEGWNGGVIEHQWIEADAIESRLRGLRKVDRAAKLEYPQPPENAIVLFAGDKQDNWAFGKTTNKGLLIAGAKTKKDDFTDLKLHFETRIPLRPTLQLAHPDRGNSGVFLLGAYEVQICDTFGIDFKPDRWEVDRVRKRPDTWCGAIYGLREADVNVCLPPLVWQTFDIEFIAARFNGDTKVSDAKMSVHQNGVLIHENVSLEEGTGGGPKGPHPEVASGPIYFQSHGSPNEFRNIWVVERDQAVAQETSNK